MRVGENIDAPSVYCRRVVPSYNVTARTGRPVERDEMASGIGINRNVGMLLLAIWLILTGLSGLAALPIPAVIMTVLALLAGILILVGR